GREPVGVRDPVPVGGDPGPRESVSGRAIVRPSDGGPPPLVARDAAFAPGARGSCVPKGGASPPTGDALAPPGSAAAPVLPAFDGATRAARGGRNCVFSPSALAGALVSCDTGFGARNCV